MITDIIVSILIYYLLGILISTAIMDRELETTYTSLSDYLVTIILAIFWPILVFLFLSALAVKGVYIWLNSLNTPI